MCPNEEISRILIIDDDPFDLDILRNILESDYALKISIDGMGGLKLARSNNPPDLILLDIMMSGMDGFEVCRQLKSAPETFDIPVVFITGKTGAEDETAGLQLGAVDYITKPFNASVVLARVKTHLALMSAHRQVTKLNEQLLSEREIVEDIVVKMRQSDQFDGRNLRHWMMPLERTTGDLILSSFRPDGGQHLMLGDFTGHGLTAAIGGPLVSDIFYVKTVLGVPMETIFTELNLKLHAVLRSDMFLVGCFLELNPERNRLTVWNCGFYDVFIFRDSHLVQTIPSEHMPRGLVDQPDRDGTLVDVKKGDRVFVYSDGIVEETNPSEKMYGTDRLCSFLHQIITQNLVLESINDDLETFREGREQSDDIILAEWTC